MSEFAFESITAAEAARITAQDVIIVRQGSALQTTVIYGETSYDVTIGDRTVAFGNGLLGIANGSDLNFVFPDGSVLFVGDRLDDRPFLPLNPRVPQNGAAYGGQGNDVLTIGEGSWLLQGNQGDDLIRIGSTDRGNATVYGGQGSDTVAIERGGTNFVQGNKGDDIIQALGAANTLLGGQGSDTITSGGVADFVNGNLGDDQLTGTGMLLGEGGNDTLNGGYRASSTLRGGDGADQITVRGDAGFGFASFAYGDEGDDRIVSNSFQYDELFGGAGNDTIITNNSPIDGGDLLDGGDGDDLLMEKGAFSGDDTINGGAGADTIDTGGGQDVSFGGAGADRFILTWFTDYGNNALGDRILDWSSEDRIDLGRPVTRGYTETTAPDVQSATAIVRALVSQFPASTDDAASGVVAVQIGTDVHLYSLQGVASILVGRTLADISGENFL